MLPKIFYSGYACCGCESIKTRSRTRNLFNLGSHWHSKTTGSSTCSCPFCSALTAGRVSPRRHHVNVSGGRHASCAAECCRGGEQRALRSAKVYVENTPTTTNSPRHSTPGRRGGTHEPRIRISLRQKSSACILRMQMQIHC